MRDSAINNAKQTSAQCGIYERQYRHDRDRALARVGDLESQVKTLQNDLCQVHTVNPCDGCQRGYRLRDMETISGKRLCIHCLKAHAERLVECMVAASPYDERAVAGAEFGAGQGETRE